MILVARQRARSLAPRTGLQDNRGDFDSAEHDPDDRSAVLPGYPIPDGGAETEN